MYTIKTAAELTGVPEATLRAWERRYAVVHPERTEGGYRVYSDADLDVVRAVVALIDRGYPPSQAAREIREGGAPTPRAAGVTGPEPAAGEASPPPRAAAREPEADEDATGRLITSAVAVDALAVAQVLDEQLATGSFERVVDGWLMPALREIGLAWEDGRLSVAGEHLVAHAVHRRFSAAFEAARIGGTGPTVVVGLPPGARHELGLFAFAVALRRAGADVLHLGPDVPVEAWRAALDAHEAAAAVIAAPTAEDVEAAQEVVTTLTRSHPRVGLVVGGGQQDTVTGRRLIRPGHLIGPAASRVAAELTGIGQDA